MNSRMPSEPSLRQTLRTFDQTLFFLNLKGKALPLLSAMSKKPVLKKQSEEKNVSR